MILPRSIRKILAIFRGGVSPVIILLSVGLGFSFGLVPGWSGFHTAIIILMLVLNIHLGLFLLSAAIGKALCLAAAPVLFHVGAWVQSSLPGLLSFLASVPIIGMTDFSRYSVAGAIVLGPVIGMVAGLFMARSVISFRRMLLKFEEGSEKFKKWYSNRWVRILDRLLVGKRTKDAKALFTAKAKIIRKAGVILAVLVLAVSAIAVTLVKDGTIKNYATKTMTRANGAEVNLDSLDLSVLTGDVSVSGIQVTDAKQPEKNQVSIETIAADASVYNLLLGKLVMENVEVSNVKFGQSRAEPGSVLGTDTEQEPVFDPNDFKIGIADIQKLETYFKNAKAVKQWLQKVRKWLPEGEKEAAEVQPEEIPQKYLEYLDARAVVPPSPRVLAKRVLLDKVEIPSQLFGNSKLLLTNVSDSARTVELPVGLEVKSYDTPAFVKVIFDYTSQDPAPRVSGIFEGLDLSRLQSSLDSKAGLTFEKGTASGKFDGEITNEIINLAVNLSIRNLQATSQGDGVLGLGSKTTSEALKVLHDLDTTVRIVGPISEPRLEFDRKGLVKQFKDSLFKAGKERASEEIDKQLEKIDEKLGDKVPDEVKKGAKELIKGLGGLLGGKDDKEQ